MLARSFFLSFVRILILIRYSIFQSLPHAQFCVGELGVKIVKFYRIYNLIYGMNVGVVTDKHQNNNDVVQHMRMQNNV